MPNDISGTTGRDPNCRRCHGTGSYEMERDCHRSAGIVPCYCKAPVPESCAPVETTPVYDSTGRLVGRRLTERAAEALDRRLANGD